MRNDPARVAAVNDVLAEVVRRHPERLTFLPLADWLCEDGKAIPERAGTRLRSDGVHFTREGATMTWNEWWLPRLRALLAAPS